jgi:hypothetical protein
VCALFAIARGPGERLSRYKIARIWQSYPSAILLGPRIIAFDWPADLPAQNLARPASEKLFASTTLVNTSSELRSVAIEPIVSNSGK